MRKRAQIKQPQHIESPSQRKQVIQEKKPVMMKKGSWVPIVLIGIFCMVLILNSHFNIQSGFTYNPEGTDVSDTFYLAGPDPYYNMRIVETTLETGHYPFYADNDPLLNYPLGRSGGRAPLLNMLAIEFSRVLVPFMGEIDAVGYSMQFVPALFGAMIIFPVYFIGKTVFGKKEGLLAAFLVGIVPIHVASGHGSAFSLFDHDSLNLLLFMLIFYFLIKSMIEKDSMKSLLFALLSGTSAAALTMVWVEARFIYAVIAVYAVVQILVDILRDKAEWRVVRNLSVILFSGYLISLPVLYTRGGTIPIELSLVFAIGVLLFGLFVTVLNKSRIPWIITLPVVILFGGAVAMLLYYIETIKSVIPFLSPLTRISDILYGSGIYGNKVDLTIAEAGTYGISRTVMSYGPVIYWLAWAGFVLLIWWFIRSPTGSKLGSRRRDYLFIIVVFAVNIWLSATAGRFLNDLVPFVAILAAWMIWFVMDRINYKQMIRNIRNAGGGIRGLRRGMKLYHLLGILFVAVLVVMPNAFLAMDAAVPVALSKNNTSNTKFDYFGEDYSGAFGQNGIPGQQKEEYWVDAFAWLSQQDTDIADPSQRPAFISWWDYGFYEVAVGDHPTVADNFQDGIPPAANFHTATSEIRAVAVFIVRLLEGSARGNGGVLPSNVKAVLEQHVGENDSRNITQWIEDPTTAPSFGSPIGAEYDEELSQQVRVGEQYRENAAYHDITDVLNATFDDEGITWLYHDLQEVTGYSIRYYGVEGYDYNQIFNIFAFLADKSLVLYAFRIQNEDGFWNPEDDFQKVYYTGYEVDQQGNRVRDGQWTAEELNEMSEADLQLIRITNTADSRKETFYDTMVYKTYIGAPPQQGQDGSLRPGEQQLPCYLMRHFAVEYLSPYGYYNTGKLAVVIAKYYEGAYINGTLTTDGEPIQFSQVIVFDEFGIPHDTQFTESDGNFSILVPAGNISVQFRLGQEVVLDEIVFNSTTDDLYRPVSDDEAMRLVDYIREINVSVSKSMIEGYLYEDINDNDTYEPDIDSPLSGVTVNVVDELFGKSDGTVTTDETGYYQISDLYASQYQITAVHNGFEIHNQSIPINPGNRSYNISNPTPASVSGVVYLDENDNSVYDEGEEQNNVQVGLLYTRNNNVVGTTTTDATGAYSFTDLVPGTWEYQLTATVQNTATGYNDYSFSRQLSFSENESKEQDIKLELAPITVSGTATHETSPVGELTVRFTPDDTVENNTAESDQIRTNADGTYTTELPPGAYMVRVDDSTDEGIYTYTATLTLTMGQGIKTYNIPVTKESKTITGTLTYQNTPVSNLSILFTPDPSVENNTAEPATITASENGQYQAELLPGTYVVTVDEEETIDDTIYRYSYEDTLTVSADSSYSISLDREELLE